jgi:hypothetical protein
MSAYGCPEKDPRAEKITGVEVAADRKSVKIQTPSIKRGRVYELHLDGVKLEGGKENLLHPEAYYTVNHLRD